MAWSTQWPQAVILDGERVFGNKEDYMARRKTHLLLFIFLPLIIGGITASILSYRAGFLRREVAILPAKITGIASWGIFVSIAAWNLFLILWCVFFAMLKNGEIAKDKPVFILCSILTVCLAAFNCMSLHAHAQTYIETERVPYFTTLSLEELDGLQKKKFTGAVYIERYGCTLCYDTREIVEAFLDKEHKAMFHYDTNQDRDRDYEGMLKTINKYGVEEVPSIIILKAGEVIAIYTYNKIMDGTAMLMI